MDGMVGGLIDKLVVQDLDGLVLRREEGDLICDGLGIGEGRYLPADVGEGEDNLLGSTPRQLRLALLAQDAEIVVARFLLHQASRCARETGVHAPAQPFVGTGDDEEGLDVAFFRRLGLGLLEKLLRCFAVLFRRVHCSLGFGEFGAGDDLHRLGDLGDVLDRL